MSVDMGKRIEVEALHQVLDDLDYYRLLKLKPGAPIPLVEKSYSLQSKEFHPDRFFGVRDPKFMKMVTQIFKKLTEAYQVLKDPELKKMYDKKLGVRSDGDASVASGSTAAISKADLEAERDALEGDSIVSDKRARKYWDLAQIAASNQDWNGVVMNLQFAMNYEKDNPIIKEKLATAKIRMREKTKKTKNPYKIKIV